MFPPYTVLNITINDLRILESIISLNNDILPRSGQILIETFPWGPLGKRRLVLLVLGGWRKNAFITHFLRCMFWLYTDCVLLSSILCLARRRDSDQLSTGLRLGPRSSGFLPVPGSPRSGRPSLTRTHPLLVGWPGDILISQNQYVGALKPTVCGLAV